MTVKKGLFPGIIGVLLVFTLFYCCPCTDPNRDFVSPPPGYTGTGRLPGSGTVQVVTTIPVETAISDAGTPRAADVWVEMIDGAKRSLDFAQFYLTGQGDGPLEPVVKAVLEAANRGVEVRILTDIKMAENSKNLAERFGNRAGIRVKWFDWQGLNGGILHAKFFIVDGKEAFVGSQNFDWRALAHIHETGLRIGVPPVVDALSRIFQADWDYHSGRKDAYSRAMPPLSTPLNPEVFLVSSPPAFNPPGIGSAVNTLIRLIDDARKSIQIQLLSYDIHRKGGEEKFTLVDDALRRAARRGAKIRMLVSDWNQRKPGVQALQDLARVPGIEIKFATIPPHSGGFIPYARVIHSKVMRVDDHISWVGTSNWGYDYFFRSRNVEVVTRLPGVAQTLDTLFQRLWEGPYTYPVDPEKEYIPPRIR